MLNIQRIVVNMIEENCYILWDETGEAAIADCGAFYDEDRESIRNFIADKALTPKLHLLTHGHFDHIFGAQFVADTYGLLPQMAETETDNYKSQQEQLRMFLRRDLPLSIPQVGKTLKDGETVCFGHQEFTVIYTPGHTPGGVCYYNAKEKVLLSGDSLFQGSIGRTDFPGGSGRDLVNSLRQRILTLPEDVTVLPGHGPETSIEFEKRNNPYF